MLKRLLIENYRSCVHTALDPDPHLSVLIGPNGGGKTNILQSIMLLNKLSLQDSGMEHRVARGASSRLKATFQFGSVTVQLKASFDTYKSTTVDGSSLACSQNWLLKARNGKEFSAEIPLAFPSVYGSDWASLRRQPWVIRRFTARGKMVRGEALPEIPLWVARAMHRVADFCRGIKYYSASQFTNPVSCPASFEIEEEGNRRRLYRLRGHERVLYDMYSAEQSRKDGRYDRFVDIVGPHGLGLIDGLSFRKVRTSSTDYSVRVGGKVEVRRRNKLLIIPRFKIGRLILSPNQLSEGTFKTLALLFHVVTKDSHALLIEEPEVCVHHGLLSSILELIKSYSRHRQTIISTHSDYVLDHVGPENVYSVTFDKQRGTVVRHLTKTMSRKELLALRDYLGTEGNLGEYWREGGFANGSKDRS